MLPVNVKLQHGGATIDVAAIEGTYFAKRLTYGTESLTTGIRTTYPTWKVDGDWPADDSRDVVVGGGLRKSWGQAERSSEHFVRQLPQTWRLVQVSGILSPAGR